MNTVESIQCFSIHFTRALDVKGNFEAFAFLNLWNVPNDVEATFTVFRGHGDVISLAIGTLEFPVLDFKLRRQYIVDVKVAERRVSIVLKQDQHFIAAFATQRDGLLSGTEVSAVVNDLQTRRINGFTCANWTKALCTEFDSGRCINATIARRGVRGVERIGDFHLLTRLETNGSTGANGQHHGVALAIR